MNGIEVTLQRLAASLSHMLEPVAQALDRLAQLARTDLDRFGLGYAAQSAILTTLWMLAVAIAILSLTGWLRLVAVLVTTVLLAKMYGLLPGV